MSTIIHSSYICRSCLNRLPARHGSPLPISNHNIRNISAKAARKKFNPHTSRKPLLPLSHKDTKPTAAEIKEELILKRLRKSWNGVDMEKFKSQDSGYVPAETWDGLEWIGGKNWIDETRDPGDKFEGWAKQGKTQMDQDAVLAVWNDAVKNVFSGEVVSEDLEVDVTKRMQLAIYIAQHTGVRISDSRLQEITTIGQFQTALLQSIKSEKPLSTIYEDKFSEIPNVTVYNRRVTAIDKDKMKGRWGLIAQALKDRGLPVESKNATPITKLLGKRGKILSHTRPLRLRELASQATSLSELQSCSDIASPGVVLPSGAKRMAESKSDAVKQNRRISKIIPAIPRQLTRRPISKASSPTIADPLNDDSSVTTPQLIEPSSTVKDTLSFENKNHHAMTKITDSDAGTISMHTTESLSNGEVKDEKNTQTDVLNNAHTESITSPAKINGTDGIIDKNPSTSPQALQSPADTSQIQYTNGDMDNRIDVDNPYQAKSEQYPVDSARQSPGPLSCTSWIPSTAMTPVTNGSNSPPGPIINGNGSGFHPHANVPPFVPGAFEPNIPVHNSNGLATYPHHIAHGSQEIPTTSNVSTVLSSPSSGQFHPSVFNGTRLNPLNDFAPINHSMVNGEMFNYTRDAPPAFSPQTLSISSPQISRSFSSALHSPIDHEFYTTQALRQHISNLYCNNDFADSTIYINAIIGKTVHLPAHAMILARSPKLRNFLTNERRNRIQINEMDYFRNQNMFSYAIRYLYGGSVLQRDYITAQMDSPRSAMENILSYVASGCFLEMPDICGAGLALVHEFLHIENVEIALDFALQRSTVQSQQQKNGDANHTHSRYGPLSQEVLTAATRFLSWTLCNGFEFDPNASQLENLERVPKALLRRSSSFHHESRQSVSNPKLQGIRLGDFGSHFPINSVISSILLSVPFFVLQSISNDRQLQERLSTNHRVAMWHQVIGEREHRRANAIAVMKSMSAEQIRKEQDILDASDALSMTEIVEIDSLDDGGYNLPRLTRRSDENVPHELLN